MNKADLLRLLDAGATLVVVKGVKTTYKVEHCSHTVQVPAGVAKRMIESGTIEQVLDTSHSERWIISESA